MHRVGVLRCISNWKSRSKPNNSSFVFLSNTFKIGEKARNWKISIEIESFIFIFLSNHFGANAGRARDDTYSQKQWHCLMPVDPQPKRRPSPIVSTRRQWRFRNASSAKQWSFMRSRTRHNGRHSGSCVTIDILSGVLSTLLTSFDFTSFVHPQSIQIRTLFTSLLFLFSQSVVQRRKAKLE